MRKKIIKVKRNTCLITRYVEGKIISLNSNNGQLYRLNPVATYIWKLLWKPRTTKEIAQKIIGEYRVTFQQAEEDIISFVKESLENKLLKVVD